MEGEAVHKLKMDALRAQHEEQRQEQRTAPSGEEEGGRGRAWQALQQGSHAKGGGGR